MDKIIGQVTLKKRAEYFINAIKGGERFNFLVTGGYGTGKTLFCTRFQNAIGKATGRKLLSGTAVEGMIGLPDNAFDREKNYLVIFIDEIHVLRNYEWLYSSMASKRFIFIFATNKIVPQELASRCVQFQLEALNLNEMNQVIKPLLNLPDEFLSVVVKNANLNPRVAIQYASEIATSKKKFFSPEELSDYMFEVLGVKDGLDSLSRRYLSTLENSGGRLSLQNLSAITGVSSEILKEFVEPVLISKKLITVGSGGRFLKDNPQPTMRNGNFVDVEL